MLMWIDHPNFIHARRPRYDIESLKSYVTDFFKDFEIKKSFKYVAAYDEVLSVYLFKCVLDE
jgi:hypothetical protein